MRASSAKTTKMACLWHRLGFKLTSCTALAAQAASMGQVFQWSRCS